MPDAPESEEILPVNRLILELAESRRQATDEEIQRIREHVASVGYQPGAMAKAGSRIAGLVWEGQAIQSSHWMDNALVHYLRHVVAQAEWPSGTTVAEYNAILRAIIEDPTGGILLTCPFDAWQLTFVSESHDPERFNGRPWIAVGYGVNYGFWMTGYRPRFGLAHFTPNADEGERWLCQPRNQTA